MTNLPRDTSRFSIAVKRYDDGTGSVHMHRLQRGDTVSVSEPKGNLHLQNYGKDVVFLSTGTGATPMIAMLREYLERGDGHAYYMHGEKTAETRLFTSELTLLEAEHDNVDVVHSLSEESWRGREGFIQDHVEDVVDDVTSPDYYVCGVPAMVVSAKERLSTLGVPDDQIISEGWEDDAA
jgi:ferredoxin-NADP reductase